MSIQQIDCTVPGNVVAPQATVERTIASLCPICLKVISAHIFQEGRAVMIEKRCGEHGAFKDTYWSDARLYRKFVFYWSDGSGLQNPASQGRECPFDCGICGNHLTRHPPGKHRHHQPVQPFLPHLLRRCRRWPGGTHIGPGQGHDGEPAIRETGPLPWQFSSPAVSPPCVKTCPR